MGKNPKWLRRMPHPLGVFVASLAVGLLINLSWGEHQLTGDEGDYYQLAVQFSQTWKFGTPGQQAYRAPLYPMVVGLAFRLVGDSLVVARVLNSILAAGMATGAGLIAGRITKQVWPMYLAAGILAIQSYWWLHQVVLMQENLASLFLVFSVFCWPIFGSKDRAITKRIRKHGLWVVAGGVLLGLSLLAKPSIVPIFVVLPLLSLILSNHETRRTKVAFAIIYLACAAVTLMPWTFRNYAIFGRWVPITTGSGEVFWGSNAPQTISNSPGSWKSTELPENSRLRLKQLAPGPQQELLSSELKWNAGWESIKQSETSRLAYHFLMKVLRLWSPSTFFGSEDVSPILKYLLVTINFSILALFAYSLFRPSSEEILLISIFTSVTLTSLVFWGSIRFLYVAQPIIAGLAAQSVFRWYHRYKVASEPTDSRRKNRNDRQPTPSK